MGSPSGHLREEIITKEKVDAHAEARDRRVVVVMTVVPVGGWADRTGAPLCGRSR